MQERFWVHEGCAARLQARAWCSRCSTYWAR
jgi:hypothetical protein